MGLEHVLDRLGADVAELAGVGRDDLDNLVDHLLPRR